MVGLRPKYADDEELNPIWIFLMILIIVLLTFVLIGWSFYNSVF